MAVAMGVRPVLLVPRVMAVAEVAPRIQCPETAMRMRSRTIMVQGHLGDVVI